MKRNLFDDFSDLHKALGPSETATKTKHYLNKNFAKRI